MFDTQTLQNLYAHYRKHPQVCIDTNQVQTQGIFFAVGQKDQQGVHRGAKYAAQALQKGAAFAIVNDKNLLDAHPDETRLLWVEDCERALQAFARYHREQLTLPVLAIAGSNGKTTTKELLAAVLSPIYKLFATPGNLNNHLGVPLSILQIRPEHELAIIEIGANHLHETFELCQIAQPTLGVVTNCGRDHLGEYGSVENIIRANCELYDYLQTQLSTQVFVHQNDPDLYPAAQKIQQVRAYGQGTNCEAKVLNRPFIKAEIRIGEQVGQAQTRLFGRFWADTLAAVACIADSLGADLTQILAGFEAYTPQALRSQQIVWENIPVLLDCYNANPSSMQVFVEEIQTLEHPKLLILGEMLELGGFSDAEHAQMLGLLIPNLYEKLILVGKAWQFLQTSPIVESQPNRLIFVPSYEEAAAFLQKIQAHYPKNQQLHIYVKGSRGNKLEKIFANP